MLTADAARRVRTACGAHPAWERGSSGHPLPPAARPAHGVVSLHQWRRPPSVRCGCELRLLQDTALPFSLKLFCLLFILLSGYFSFHVDVGASSVVFVRRVCHCFVQDRP